jgi:hypothetical protein
MFGYRGARSGLVLLAVVLGLCACGGGGGSSGGGTLTLSTATLSASATSPGGGGAVLFNPFTWVVSAQGTYYFRVSFGGTAIASMVLSGQDPVMHANTTNPEIGPTQIGYAIGGTYTGSWTFGADPTAVPVVQVDLVDTQALGAGTYRDQITFEVCNDAACTQPIAGSPKTVAVSYTVTGNPVSIADVRITPLTAQVEAPSTQGTAASGSVHVQAGNLPPNGAYVAMMPGPGGLVTGTSFSSSLSPSPGQDSTGTIGFTLKPPATVGPGIHSDTLRVNVCFDQACTKPAAGSPFTVNVSYVVDPTAGAGYTQKSLPILPGAMVWDSATQRIYAAVPGYSATDPNTLVRINPATGTIETAVSLNGGVGQVEPLLAVSDDGSYVYAAVSTNGSDTIERIRTSDMGLDLQVPLASFVESLAPAPGDPHTLAVELLGSSVQVLLYVDGTAQSASYTNSASQGPLAWGADATTLFAEFYGGPGYQVAALTTATMTATQTSGLPNTASGTMLFDNDLLLWSSGTVFNTTQFAAAAPFVFHTSVPLVDVFGLAIAVDPGLDRAYFLTSDQPANAATPMITLEGRQLSTRAPLWLARFPIHSAPNQLIRWGSNGLAFADGDGSGSLILISGNIVTQ